MEKLSPLQKEILKKISEQCLFSFETVEKIFIACKYSFDKTIKAIELSSSTGANVFTIVGYRLMG